MKKLGILWPVILIFLFSYLIYQNTHIEHYNIEKVKAKEPEEGKTLLLTAKEKNFVMKNKGFDSLYENLRFWEFDEVENKVYLREESLIPTINTPLLFIYTKAYDSFIDQENVIPVSIFPYSVEQDSDYFQIIHIDDKGKVYIMFRNKKISLLPGESFYDIWFDGIQLRNIKIENLGLFNQEDFLTFETERKKENK